ASATSEAAKTYAQLQAAKNVVSSPDYQRDEYPIVELPFVGLERSLYLEFVKFDGPGNQKINWIGALRSTARSAHLFKTPDVMFNTMIESLRVPSLQLRSLAATLSEQHGHLSYRERDQLLRQLEADLERVNLLWNNFQEIYALENNTLALNREQADLADLLRRVLEARPLNRFQRSFVVDAPPLLPTVRLDEFRMERALADVLQRALDVSPPDTQIAVRITNHEHELRLTVEDNGPALRPEQVDQIFEPWSITRDRAASGFGLYVARELVRRHGGRTWVEARHPNGAAITIALPVAAAAPRLADEPPPVYADAVLVDADLTPRMRPAGLPAVAVAAAAAAIVAPPPAVETPPRSAPIRAPQRSPSTVMIVLGASSLTSALRDALEKQNYDLLVYQRADEALEDVTATRLDLIVIDAAPSDINGLELCARMRKRTEVPIMLVADNASDQEKVLGFRAGADEYVTRPVSDEELMARVQAIFKRQQIPERTSEPLVVGNLIVDVARREVLLNGAPVELTRIEFDLLHLLISNRNRVLTHRQLLEKVWGPDYEDETHYLWVNISRLRKKLEPTPDSPRYIHTQPGIGYYFDEL
ncbi:MAG: winged helix-turn-helix domain-containing protein, partial [Anaerolineae bacterium]|nr:winged helix-turn-helix domain-containing protein [Anaerolineae bacterium]